MSRQRRVGMIHTENVENVRSEMFWAWARMEPVPTGPKQMSCCKSYLGKNNEVKEGEEEVEEDRTRKKSSYDPMTSNLPECFFRCLIMTTFLAFYMCIGAAIFCAIEREEEKEHSREMIEMWDKFQKENSIPQEKMDKFLHKHYEMCEMGDHNHEGNNIQWDYVSSLFFTGTILTTIGYGHSSPATLGGRVFTIFYAIAGIPFMLGLLNVVAEILLTTLKIIKSKFKKKPYPDVFHHEVFISALACVVALLIFMTFVFKVQESSWTYEQSIYFSFITMTTIGFGDFVPAQVNVENNSPTLITREFLNLILIFVSVLVWYFLSQVSAQVLKVHLKGLYRKLESKSSFFNKTNNKYPEIEANHQVDGDSDDPEIGPDRCTCNCTCGYDHMTDSASGVLDTHSAVSDRSMAEFQHPNNNLECIKDDDDGELDYDDQSSVSSVQSSENNTSHNIDFSPRLQPDQVAEPSETPLKIPSIVITPVDPSAKLSSNTNKENAAYSTLLNSENVDHPCDSGKGSSEITTFTCQTNDIISNNISPSQSSDSLSSNSSGVFSDSLSKAGVYVNGGFMPSTPRMKRSKSEEVGSSSFISSISIGSKGIRRISRSLTDLAFSNKPYKHLDERRLSGVEYSRKVESFSIHTKVFDDMMKS
ncbi:uncharacterized protein LOC134814493 isoform X5 [Bolinopsis microptera]|uniref:uncharacterized protein LOC134814493 isoform X5 n=1 Tax=Bolinopsis microptera TaxID=2820187 RepID=UPI003079F1C3